MLFEDKTQNNIMMDLVDSVDRKMNTEEGTLINHSFRGAAAEFEKVYISLGIVDQNGNVETADREHLILRAKERGIVPFSATNAIWKATFQQDIPLSTRFSARGFTYVCQEELDHFSYRLMCEQKGTAGNINRGELSPIEYLSGYESGELIELLIPARDEEETEDFRSRYLSIVRSVQAFGGNRAQYKQVMYEINGVGACKIYRVEKEERKIKIYFLNNLYRAPSEALISDVQQIIDPYSKQGEGEGKAPIFHVVEVFPCLEETIQIETEIFLDTGYVWEDLLPLVQKKIEQYYLELAKSWENEEYLTVRVLKINAAIAAVEGIVDVQGTKLNGKEENVFLDPNAIPVEGELCRR